MKKSRISVIMGIYNCAGTIEEAIKSIIDQTYKNWELIMCDDGSTDNTYEVAKKYADKYNNIILIKNEKNMRLAYTLNHCLSVAEGEYIARMDADDICLPTRFEKQVKYLDEHPEMSAVGSAAIVFDERGDKLIRGMGCEYPVRKTVNTSTPFIHPSIMMRKSAYDELGGYTVSEETMRAEDLDLWYRFRLAGMDGYVIQEPLLRYRENSDDFKKRSLKAAIGMMRLNKKYFRELNIPMKYNLMIYKPVISALIPIKLMKLYHRKR